MLYVVIERYRDPAAVYHRLREKGRGFPEGLRCLHSWVTPEVERCYQVMECEERALLDGWLASWADLVQFEIVPVISSDEAAIIAQQRDNAGDA